MITIKFLVKSLITNKYYTKYYRNYWDSNIEEAYRFNSTDEILKEFNDEDEKEMENSMRRQETFPYVVEIIIE